MASCRSARCLLILATDLLCAAVSMSRSALAVRWTWCGNNSAPTNKRAGDAEIPSTISPVQARSANSVRFHTQKGTPVKGRALATPGSGVFPAGARVSADMPHCATSFTMCRKTERDSLELRQDRRDTGTNTLSRVAFQLLNSADAGSYAARGELV